MHHRQRSSAAVVTPMQKSIRKGKIRPCKCKIVTPENFISKLCIQRMSDMEKNYENCRKRANDAEEKLNAINKAVYQCPPSVVEVTKVGRYLQELDNGIVSVSTTLAGSVYYILC